MGLFKKKIKQEYKIMQQADRTAGQMLPEYHRAPAECPNPELWHMYDSMTAEVEVLEFLRSLVTTLKPRLIIETGSFLGVSTLWMAEGLEANGFGKIISCEFDPIVYQRASDRIAASPLSSWIDLRNQSSMDLDTAGQEIDMFFSDSDVDIRGAEVRRFLPLIRATGVILIHDASSHMKTVREAAIDLEREGLLSCVFLPTPRGLVLAQRRQVHLAS